MLAQDLRASPDGYIASHDDTNGRTIRRIMAAAKYDMVIDVAVLPNLRVWVEDDSQSAVPQPRTFPDLRLRRQDAVVHKIDDSLQHTRNKRNPMQVQPMR
jgi:hypothetical protein